MGVAKTWLVPAVLLCLPGPALADEYCDGLREISSQTGSAWEALRGTPIAMTPTWTKYQGRRQLTGAAKCEIDATFKSYMCEWELASKNAMTARQAELAGAVQQCFPGAYSARTDKSEIAFWVGQRRAPGAFAVKIRTMKVRGDYLAQLVVEPY